MEVLRIIVFLLGLMIALDTLFSAVKTTVLPGRKKVWLTRVVFRNTFRLFRFVARRVRRDEVRDRILAMYAPTSVMLLPLTWVILLIIGDSAMFWATGVSSFGQAMTLSGAALTTLGFLAPQGGVQTILYVCTGVIGLGIIGLLITFLPTSYSIYSQREQEVTRVAFRFGAPPSGAKVLAQAYQLGLAQELDQFWHTWEEWFTAMYETHLSDSAVIFYRSSQPGTSWITTAGALLDAGALFSSTVDRQDGPWLKLCLQAGTRTLRDLASDAGLRFRLDFASSEAVHVTRAEYEAACEQLRSAGVPLKPDHEESWRAFVRIRSQYDLALLALASLVYAPEAPWSSDRKIGPMKIKLFR
jgi:hypothetical protein